MNYTSASVPASILPKAKAFLDEFKKEFGKNPEPYAAEAYDATAVAIRAIEEVAKTGKLSRESVSATIRKTKLVGVTGDIAFDGNGDRVMASYFVLEVASENPEVWNQKPPIVVVQCCGPTARRRK